jgi:hypothetical protein
MVLYNRPHYTRTVLNALRRCHGIGDYLVLPRIEPGNEEVIELARAIDFAEVQVTVNPDRYGSGRNTYHAWEDGFKRSDFIVHIEDDTVPAPDCLRYMEHCRGTYRRDHQIFSVAAYNRYRCLPTQYFAIGRRFAYTCWLVGVWNDRWLWAKRKWSTNPRDYASPLAHRTYQHGLREVYPLLSRSQNIGAKDGIHHISVAWHRVYQHTDHWAGDLALRRRAFRELANPLVTAVLIAGHERDDLLKARRAIKSFKQQSYVHKELLIVNYGGPPLDPLDDARIREIRLTRKRGITAEMLRDLGQEYARGDVIIAWDAADWQDSECLVERVARQEGKECGRHP